MESFDLVQIVQTLIASIAACVVASIVGFSSKAAKGEKFSWNSFGETVVIGFVLGCIAAWKGLEINTDNFKEYAAANVGAIHVADKVWAALRNWWKSRGGKGVGPLFAVVLLLAITTSCATFPNPETPPEKLAYAQATLTGLTTTAAQLMRSGDIDILVAKRIDKIITDCEDLLRLARIVISSNGRGDITEHLMVLMEKLIEINKILEGRK